LEDRHRASKYCVDCAEKVKEYTHYWHCTAEDAVKSLGGEWRK
jgi:hypothetical protein